MFQIIRWLPAVLLAAVAASPGRQLDTAIQLTPEEIEALTRRGPAPQASPTGGFSISTTDRVAVAAFYHCAYAASEGWQARMRWTGDVANCVAGTVSNDFHDDTLRRINYFRAMAGLNANITLDAGKNADCQRAALMMARNNQLNHYPPPSWFCFTAAGSNAAGKANLSLGGGGYTGPTALDGQMRDDGIYNTAVGHRRWLLYSKAAEMGNGGVPDSVGYNSAAVVWVIGAFNPAAWPAPFIAWPPSGYVPYPVVYPRWSFALTNASLSSFVNATVTMTQNGAPMTLVKIHPTPASPAAGYGDSAIVWEPQGLPAGAPATDIVYTVSISNISGVASSSYSYTVRVIDPDVAGVSPTISGPTNPVVGTSSLYSFTPVPHAAAYSLRTRKAVSTNWTEGAEASPPPRVIDGTGPEYDLIQSSVKRTGANAFHLAFPDFAEQWFEVDRVVLPTATSALHFAYLRRFSATDNFIRAQVTTTDGLSWNTLWSIGGVCGGGSCDSDSWDSSFRATNVSLSAYAGRPLRIRLHFDPVGSVYIGSDANHGVFFDDVAVSGAMEVVQETLLPLASNAVSFTFQPDSAGRYLLDIQPTVDCHTFGYGPVFAANVITGGVPVIAVRTLYVNTTQAVIGFAVQGGSASPYSLKYLAGSMAATNWLQATGAVFDAGLMQFTAPRPATNPVFYRVSGAM